MLSYNLTLLIDFAAGITKTIYGDFYAKNLLWWNITSMRFSGGKTCESSGTGGDPDRTGC